MENSATFLDALVRLATIGASGVCIFAVFWIGVIIRKPRPDATAEWYKSTRHYMVACILCAAIAGATGTANAMFNANKIRKVSNELVVRTDQLTKIQRAVENIRSLPAFSTLESQALNPEVVQSLQVLKAVETDAPGQ